MSVNIVQIEPDPQEEDGPTSAQPLDPTTSFSACPNPTLLHYRSGSSTPWRRPSSPTSSPGICLTLFSTSEAPPSYWEMDSGLKMQRRASTRKVAERAWYSKKRAKWFVGVIGLLVLFFLIMGSVLNSTKRLLQACNFFSPVKAGSEALTGLQDAQIWCPGARISGFSTSQGVPEVFVKCGPLEENLLTTGACPMKEATLPSPIAAFVANRVANPFSPCVSCS